MDDAAIEKFKSFNLPGLKATSMHRTIIEQETFDPLLLLSDIDKKEVTLEFKRVIEYLENDATTKKKNGEFVPSHLREYGAVMHILLDWRTSPIMFQNLSTDIQNGVKQLVISTLDYIDEPHKSNGLSRTPITSQTIMKLAKYIPLDKDDYTSI